ncbi:YqzM family protein [Longirhabdus pacifica]|nr:YqzM family protein [Longirhabdus pacifica]
MSETNHAKLHTNEEPRNDFIDVALGFGVTFGIFTVVCIIFTILNLYI